MDLLNDLRVIPLLYDQFEWFIIHSLIQGKYYAYNANSGILTRLPPGLESTDPNKLVNQLNYQSIQTCSKSIFDPVKYTAAKKATRMMLFLTAACNLRCIYCHCNSESSLSHMPDETIDRAIKKYLEFKRDKADGPIEITFMGGGEPLLRLEKIKYIVAKLDEEKIPAEYSLVTNGTLGSDSDWDWIITRCFRLTISCDGPSSVQNKQRPHSNHEISSSELVYRRLKYLSKKGAKAHIRSTIINTDDIDSCANYFFQFPVVETHSMEPVSLAGRASFVVNKENNIVFYSDFFKKYSRYLYENPSRFKSAWFKPFKRMDGFCGAVYYNNVVTHDGYISLCTEIDSSAVGSKVGAFIVATVDDTNPFHSDASVDFSRSQQIINRSDCAKCIIRYKCGGGCYIKRYREFRDDLGGYFMAFCENAIRLNMSYLLYLYNSRPTVDSHE